MEDDVVVGHIRAGLMVEPRRLLACNGKSPRHAKMHDQYLVRRQVHGEEFRLPPEMPDSGPAHALGELLRKGKPQVCPVMDKALNLLPLHHGGQSAANCLDFG